MRAFEIFTEEYSKIVQANTLLEAIQRFYLYNNNDTIIAVIDVEYSEQFK